MKMNVETAIVIQQFVKQYYGFVEPMAGRTLNRDPRCPGKPYAR